MSEHKIETADLSGEIAEIRIGNKIIIDSNFNDLKITPQKDLKLTS